MNSDVKKQSKVERMKQKLERSKAKLDSNREMTQDEIILSTKGIVDSYEFVQHGQVKKDKFTKNNLNLMTMEELKEYREKTGKKFRTSSQFRKRK